MNFFLASEGADPLAHLRGHMAKVATAPFQGKWSTVEIQPDGFARQRYSIGVVVAGAASFAFRLLDDFAKFDCLYGKDDAAEMRSLAESAERTLLHSQKAGLPLDEIDFGTSALSLGDAWDTSGSSVDAVLARLYADVIPFIPSAHRRTRDFESLDNAAVRNLVDEELKRIAGLSFERISVTPGRAVMDRLLKQPYLLDFNLEPPKMAGSVISAVYKTPSTVELNFLRASRDLSTYRRIKSLADRSLGLFVMTPNMDGFPAADVNRMDSIIGEQSWNLEKQGFVVTVQDSARALAHDVWEWATPALQD